MKNLNQNMNNTIFLHDHALREKKEMQISENAYLK